MQISNHFCLPPVSLWLCYQYNNNINPPSVVVESVDPIVSPV